MKYWNKLLFEIKNHYCAEFMQKIYRSVPEKPCCLATFPSYLLVVHIGKNMILTPGDVDDCDNGDGHDDNLGHNEFVCIAI